MVSQKKKKLNFLYMLVGVTLLLLLGLIANQNFSVIGISQVEVGDDGIPYWIIQVDGKSIGGEYVFSAVSNDLEEYPTSQGTVVPQEDISITIKDISTQCIYTLGDGDDRFVDDVAQLFGSDTYYYEISPTTKTSVFMTFFDDLSNKEQTVDALDWVNGNEVSFEYNDGVINVEPLGGFVGNYQCPQLSEYVAVIDRSNYNEVKFGKYETSYFSGDYTNFEDKTSQVTSGLGMTCSVKGTDSSGTQQTIVCNVGDDNTIVSTANPVVLLTADANYLDFKYVATTVGDPEIVDVSFPDSMNAGEISSITVRVKNIGDDKGNFKVKLTSPSLTISPSTIGITLNAGESDDVSFVAVSPTGQTSDIKSSASVQFCSLGEFALAGTCDTYEDISITVGEQETFKITEDEPTCGNGVCDSNENSATCPSDCGTTLVCDGLYMSKYNNKCVCADGYEMTEDDYGNEYCAEVESEINIVAIAILLTMLVVLIIMIIVAKRRK